MNVFKTFTGIIAPLDRSNVDTDAIIPKEYLKSIKRTGFGENLFDAWRYLEVDVTDRGDLNRKPNLDFILNKSPYNKAEILLSRENFGCGSSREHAVWALSDFGFKAVIAPSFGDIFYSNSFKNGFLPIRLNVNEINALFESVQSKRGFKATIDLEKQIVKTQDEKSYSFNIDDSLKIRLLKGLDDIALTLENSKEIINYEKKRSKLTPWLFREI